MDNRQLAFKVADQSQMFVRGRVSITELEILIFLYQSPRTAKEINDHLQLGQYNAQGPYMTRLRDAGLVVSQRNGRFTEYRLSANGEELLVKLRDGIKKDA